MANILFTWEIGEGSGHVAPHINLIKQLETEGHSVFFAVRQLYNAYRLFQSTRVTCLQAPVLPAPPAALMNPVDSYAKILNNSGYSHPDHLTGMITAWKNLYAMVQPDLIVFDYSPTAMLAARDYPAKRLHIGSGFFCPPNTQPLIGLETLQGELQDQSALALFENFILDNINQALSNLNMQPLAQLGDIHDTDARLLLGFKELEHYHNRTDGTYIGMFKAPPGAVPEWPAGKGPKVFMYTKPFPTLPKLLETLKEKEWPTLVYPDGLGKELIRRFSSPTLRFVEKRLDMDTIGKTADIAICNGNFGTVCELLLSGMPMLLLPLHAEQNIVSQNIENIGAGLNAPRKMPQAMAKKLEILAGNPSFRTAAHTFANRYRHMDHAHAMEAAMATIHQLLGQGRH